ncbi:MAG: hypothetical protein ACI8QS_002790 [Planctomycetota bacterium]|jgi:uncharacterized protein
MSVFENKAHRSELLLHLRECFALDVSGIHGVKHWSRVWTNGRRLATLEEAAGRVIDHGVVELFAWFHDSCRLNDDHDPDHGPRAADLARELRGEFFELSDERLTELVRACDGHTRGKTVASPTIMVCWDADRLDLGRVGIRPDPAYLCTAGAKRKDVLGWGYSRSIAED